jgi:hypothetical protein
MFVGAAFYACLTPPAIDAWGGAMSFSLTAKSSTRRALRPTRIGGPRTRHEQAAPSPVPVTLA